MPDKKAATVYAWLAAEHARLHVIASWPDSPRKAAILLAIRSSLRNLARGYDDIGFECVLCRTDHVVEIFTRNSNAAGLSQLARAA